MRKPWKKDGYVDPSTAWRNAREAIEDEIEAFAIQNGDKDVELREDVVGGKEVWEDIVKDMSRRQRNYEFHLANLIEHGSYEAEQFEALIREVAEYEEERKRHSARK